MNAHNWKFPSYRCDSFCTRRKNLDSGDGSSRNLRLWQACTPAFLKHIGGQTQVDMLHEQIEAMQEAPLVT